ncbi:MAG: protein-methionine-sulfoxide reductase catalytic subunit MsrP [Anaerolineae bacterium]|nr:protein-methionine-sulfoxide reductase catalytic subunit MsrP [Anaerolineae bacterium]
MAFRLGRSYVTPEYLYLNRRRFMVGAGSLAAAALLAACARPTPTPQPPTDAPTRPVSPSPTPDEREPSASAQTDELGFTLTPYESVVGYTNYYEFSYDKSAPTALAKSLTTWPWSVAVGGLCNRPKTFSIEELRGFQQEERIYRLRCVEAWSMVIPWIGFPLARLLETVQPTPEAQFVRFETVYRPSEMPGQARGQDNWPYVEGLRLDEAMHDLTILATGLYGKTLTPQNGAPLRLVVPWKYGFKYIKAIVKIDLVAEMPVSTWMKLAPNEYGFYANVNPDVPHPRWSQAFERVIGEAGRRETLLFNGYGDQVADLYAGMDLHEDY